MANLTKTPHPVAAGCVLWVILFFFNVLFANSLSAQTYKIELLIFKQHPDPSLEKEFWPLEPFRFPARYLTLTTPPIQVLQSEQYALKNIAAKLKNNGYPLLLHTAWLQPFPTGGKQTPLYMTGGDIMNGEQFELQGFITLSLQKFMHITSHMIFYAPATVDATDPNHAHLIPGSGGFFGGGTVQAFTLKDTRRLKNGEITYIDNPFFGMIVVAKPIVTDPEKQ
jgi:hypothetical protein